MRDRFRAPTTRRVSCAPALLLILAATLVVLFEASLRYAMGGL